MNTVSDTETERLLEAAKLALADARGSLDIASSFYGIMREHYSGDPSLRFGTGETVPMSYVQMRARAVFFQALHRLVPESTAALLTEEAYEIVATAEDALQEWAEWVQEQADAGTVDPHAIRSYPPMVAAFYREGAHIRRWQENYNLTDDWVRDAALFTMYAAAGMRKLGQTYTFQLSVADPNVDIHAGKHPRRWSDRLTSPSTGERPTQRPAPVFSYTQPHRLIDVPVYLDDLKYPTIDHDDGYEEDEGEFGTFDPRTQTIDEAVADLLPVLEDRLRAALQTIVDEETIHHNVRRLRGSQRLKLLTTTDAFEWAVRVQVFGERRSDIAKAAGLSTDRVRKAVKELGDLMGTTFRPDPVGRRKGSKDTRPRHIGDRM